ncbi:MAG: HAD hydrolase-like protein [SAR324 cluster bacterium]|nr:haloacid dehalogenase [Deltaproteobacteria bacterium]MDP6090860.1 HAD hydrolase-like protein [SAR324 cluster bacterium]MDP6248554.1 HAD hydrolase-like protein [SAR324 cluster bacterium]MDP6464193.1 HAD hydrolase-like protein [SAR324 cluster bacterium]MDP7137318.1 HAD hydrolase-like protein [SAR324 cluster bacterium]
MFDAIGFDADDTLWHNERLFSMTQEKFRGILKEHASDLVDRTLYVTERKNLQMFGYGIKGFVLSMIETSIQLTNGDITGKEIEQIMDFGREMLGAPIQLLENVESVLQQLKKKHPLFLITKGDLIDQETKIARSGLSEYFDAIEILTEKDEETYLKVLEKYQIKPNHFLMVGNSLRSDVLPVLKIGGTTVYVPYEIGWDHEKASKPSESKFFHEMEHIGQLPAWLDNLNAKP